MSFPIEPRKRIELLKTSFPTFDQSLFWTKKTNRTLENELSNIRSVVALNQETNRTLENELSNIRSVVALNQENESNSWKWAFQLNQENESNSWKWAFQHSISRCPEPSKRIELLKTSFPTFDQSLPWTKKTNRTLENELSNARSLVALKSLPWTKKTNRTLENELSNARSVLAWTKKTNRTLENELSNARSVLALNQENESNSWKWAFQHSISRCPEPRKRIELLKMSFPTFDQSLPWTKKTNRTLENELSNIRSVLALNQENESNSWKWAFQHSISRCPEPSSVTTDQMLESSFSRVRFVFLVQGQRLIECWKTRFQEFDSFSWFRARTDRMLESSFSRVRFVFLVQGKDWSNVGKLVFKSSIRFLGSGQRLIECWKARFQEFDSFTWFRATTEENESNSWKRAFQHSISPCPEPRKRIELLKMSFPTFDQSLPWTKKTNRTLENEFSNTRSVVAPEPSKWIELLKTSFPTFDQSLPWTKKTNRTLENELSNARSVVALNHRALESSFSRVRFVFLVQGNDWSSVGKLIFKSSIRFLGSGQRLIECWKAHFQEFDSFSWFRATTEENESNSWKWAFQRSISRCPEPSNVGKLIFKRSIRFLGSGQRLIECWKAHFQEFDSFSWFRARTARMLESSFSRVRFVFLVQGKDWSSVGKLIFKSSIRLLGSGQRLIECWKARFQEFDSFSWFRATTDRMLESSFSRVRFVFLIQGNDWSNVGKLVFKSSIRFLGWRQGLIECWKARFQEFDSFSWFRARTDRMLESSFSRVRFVFLVQGNDWSSVGKLNFQEFDLFSWFRATTDRALRLIKCWKAHFQEFDSFSWFRARTDRALESSIFKSSICFLGSGQRQIERYDWSNVGKLIFKSSIRFLGSGQRLIECWKARFQEFDSFSWFSGNGLIECWKAHFQEFDSFSWFRATTDRMLESSFSRVRFVFLVQGNDWSNVGKLVFKSSIRFLGSGQRLIECWKAHFQEFDSFSWFRATTDRMLESSFSRVRFVFLVQGNDWSNVGKLIFKSSIRFLGSGQRLIECWKAHFQEFDSFSWFRATTDRALESSFSRVRFVFLVQGNDWSNVGKLVF